MHDADRVVEEFGRPATEEGAPVRPVEWARLLAEELEELARAFPPGPLDADEAASLQQLKGISEIRQAAGGDERLWTLQGGGGLVLFDPETSGVQSFSGVGRSVAVKPIRDLADLAATLRPVSPVLQTLGIAARQERRRALADSLATCGVTRVTTLARQPWPPAWWRHDGNGPLLALVRWITLEDD